MGAKKSKKEYWYPVSISILFTIIASHSKRRILRCIRYIEMNCHSTVRKGKYNLEIVKVLSQISKEYSVVHEDDVEYQTVLILRFCSH